MSIVIVDESLVATLENAEHPVEIQASDGRRLGIFTPLPVVSRKTGSRSAREILEWIKKHQITPTPGTPDSTELLREDRNR